MLPLPLWDLLLHRTYIPLNVVVNQSKRPKNVRYFQKILTKPKRYANTPITGRTQFTPSGSHSSFDNLKFVTEFESRISSVENNDLIKLDGEHQTYQVEETQLQSVYQDLFSYSDVAVKPKDDRIETDIDRNTFIELLETLEERFSDMHFSPIHVNSSSLSAQLLRDLSSVPHNNSCSDSRVFPDPLDLEKATSNISASLRSLVNKFELCSRELAATWVATGDETPALSPGLLSRPEWGILVRGALAENDATTAEKILSLMEMVGEQPSNDHYDSILNWYAQRSRVEEADMFCSRLLPEVFRDSQRDLLIKTRLRANQLNEACNMLYSYESSATPAPIRSYTRVIRAMLFHSGPGSEQSKAQAWDMFSHMRYAAHPIPDEFLYTTMIRSIAESQDPEVERALDLFTEMTIDNKLLPTTYSYNAIILVCARSKKYRLEAFRLAREMMTSHINANASNGEVVVSLRPDKYTFLALLEAAKRLGDLSRTRWILTQLIKETRRSLRSQIKASYVDEKIVAHVLHAYASYVPPFRRDIAPIEQKKEQDELEREETANEPEGPSSKALEKASPSLSRTPQTHQEVIKEVEMMWNRLLDDVEYGSVDDAVFANVTINTRLINSYVTVYFCHSPPDTAFHTFNRVYKELGVPKNAESYLIAFGAYTLGKRCTKREMQSALEHARILWPEWRALENSAYSEVSKQGMSINTIINARMVEKAWTSMFRMLAHNDCLDEAMDLVREFVKRYPPSSLKMPSPRDPSRSPKISLYAERPLVRLIERSSVPEDRIPPFLLFKDLELLHNRSVSAKRRDYVNYIKWVASAYAGALRQKQKLTFGAADNQVPPDKIVSHRKSSAVRCL